MAAADALEQRQQQQQQEQIRAAQRPPQSRMICSTGLMWWPRDGQLWLWGHTHRHIRTLAQTDNAHRNELNSTDGGWVNITHQETQWQWQRKTQNINLLIADCKALITQCWLWWTCFTEFIAMVITVCARSEPSAFNNHSLMAVKHIVVGIYIFKRTGRKREKDEGHVTQSNRVSTASSTRTSNVASAYGHVVCAVPHRTTCFY